MKKIILACIFGILFITGIGYIYTTLTNKVDEDLEVVTLAEVTHSVFYTPLYIAIENGYFEEEGIYIDLILTSGADAVSAAIISGDADVGLAGAESAIYIYEAGQEDYLQIFSGLTNKDGQFIVSPEFYRAPLYKSYLSPFETRVLICQVIAI